MSIDSEVMSLLALITQEASIISCPQIQSFTSKEDFRNSKRFTRYKNKLRTSLTQFISSTFVSWKSTFAEDPLLNWIGVTYLIRFEDLYEFEEDNLFNKASIAEKKAVDNLRIWGKLFPQYYEPNLLTSSWCEPSIRRIIQQIVESEKHQIERAIDHELANVSCQWITSKCIHSEAYDDSNYHLTLPDKTGELYEILVLLADYVHRDIERIVLYQHLSDVMSFVREEYYQKAENYIQTSQTTIEKQEETISKLESTIKEQTNQINKLKKENQKNESINSQQYIELERKYNKLKSQILKTKNPLPQPLVESPIVNDQNTKNNLKKERNYCFVMDTDDLPIYQQKLLEEFPNAKFAKGQSGIPKLNKNTIDLIIILTQFIRHSTYYGIKDEARKKNIPYIQINTKSIESIKNKILAWQEQEGEA